MITEQIITTFKFHDIQNLSNNKDIIKRLCIDDSNSSIGDSNFSIDDLNLRIDVLNSCIDVHVRFKIFYH